MKIPLRVWAMIWLSLVIPVHAKFWSVFQVDSDYQYNVMAELGKPSQSLSVALDLGTADFLVVPQRCFQGQCGQFSSGTAFNMSVSETLNLNNTFFTTEMLSGNTISGIWAVDTLQMFGYQTNLTFAIRADTNDLYYAASNFTTSTKVRNTLGIGPHGLQASVQWIENGYPQPVYDNFMHTLPNTTRSWSLWVDPNGSNLGLFIFGGMDPSTYYEETYGTMAIQLTRDRLGTQLALPSQLAVMCMDMVVRYLVPRTNQWNGADYLFTGYTWILAIFESQGIFSVPAAMLQNLAVALGGVYSYEIDSYLVACDTQAIISLILPNYILDFSITDCLLPQNLVSTSGQPMCVLNIGISDSIIIPNQMTRHYFMAVDYRNNTISFAKPKPAAPGGAPQNIIPVSSQLFTASFPGFTNSSALAAPTFYPLTSSQYQLTGVTSVVLPPIDSAPTNTS